MICNSLSVRLVNHCFTTRTKGWGCGCRCAKSCFRARARSMKKNIAKKKERLWKDYLRGVLKVNIEVIVGMSQDHYIIVTEVLVIWPNLEKASLECRWILFNPGLTWLIMLFCFSVFVRSIAKRCEAIAEDCPHFQWETPRSRHCTEVCFCTLLFMCVALRAINDTMFVYLL